MALKQVVLPAPLGPISPRISPWRISNETPSRATTPPKRRVTSRISSSVCASAPGAGGCVVMSSGMGGPLLELLELLVQLLGPHRPAWWQQPLRPEVRQQHEQPTEDQ